MVFLAGSPHAERRHIAARPFVPRPFVPRQICRYTEELGEIAGLLIDRLAEHRTGPVDLMEHLALPFASLSRGRLLAIPDDEAMRLARQVGPVFEQFATAKQHQTVASAGEELVARLARLVAGRRGGAEEGVPAGPVDGRSRRSR